jgi:acetoin utilization deacetylase AcuC-like enzyme
MTGRLQVFYREEMTVTESFESIVESARKPGLFVEAAGPSIEVVSFEPLTREEISVCHPRRHVDRVLDGFWNNGYRNAVQSLNRAISFECGSFYAAAVGALDSRITMSPSIGFHHADFGECWNFCSFNGLTIAALLMNQRGQAQRVGIIDFDCHWGNGTDAIMERLGLDFITHYTFGKFKRTVRKGMCFDRWLDDLPTILDERFRTCEILYYQAGVDARIDDQFGGELTTAQLHRRDRIVFEFAHSKQIPLVWNLAGGYQNPYSKVIELHLSTLATCLEVYGLEGRCDEGRPERSGGG